MLFIINKSIIQFQAAPYPNIKPKGIGQGPC